MWWLVEDMSAHQALTRIYEMFERGPVVQFEWSGEAGWPIRYVSPNVTNVLGLPYEQLATGEKAFAEFIFPDDLPRVTEEVKHYLSNSVVDFQQEYRILTPQGRIYWVRDYTHVIYREDGQADTIYGFVIDITMEKEALRQLEEEKRQAAWKAIHDPLTGLYNRAYLREIFTSLLRQAARQGWVVDLMFIDLDNFKEINDVHGHNVGDRILRQFATRLRRLLRRSDVIARFGGDEFVVATQLESHDRQQMVDRARMLAQKILDALEAPFEVDGEIFRLGASIGIVLVDESLQQTDIDTLIRYADTSMYLAKRSGRNGYRFFDEQQQKLEELRAQKLTALRQAIEKNELWLAYQPQVRWDGKRFQLCGAEVLMRWRSEQFGQVSPGEFIPLAEDTGYILTLGDWMVETALHQLSQWQTKGMLPPGFALSLNISAVQFYQPDLAQRLCDLCKQLDLSPQMIRLELTERIIYKGSDEALAQMKALRDLGFSTSLDDFGT
jgi:diguanylate cyclase (GGDEF)-like protein/PAS domain S-box-containing protein